MQPAYQYVVEVEPLRVAYVPAFALPTKCTIPRDSLASFIAVGGHNHIAYVVR
jgi:hypothetical protein